VLINECKTNAALFKTAVCNQGDLPRRKGNFGSLPLHSLCKFGSSPEAVDLLIDVYPGGVRVSDLEIHLGRPSTMLNKYSQFSSYKKNFLSHVLMFERNLMISNRNPTYTYHPAAQSNKGVNSFCHLRSYKQKRGVNGSTFTASAVQNLPKPVQTNNLRKENGGQDINIDLIRRGETFHISKQNSCRSTTNKDNPNGTAVVTYPL